MQLAILRNIKQWPHADSQPLGLPKRLRRVLLCVTRAAKHWHYRRSAGAQISGEAPYERRGAADLSEYCDAAGAIAQIIKPDEKLHSSLAVENEL
jgi:hypothetical protein